MLGIPAERQDEPYTPPPTTYHTIGSRRTKKAYRHIPSITCKDSERKWVDSLIRFVGTESYNSFIYIYSGIDGEKVRKIH